MSDIKHWIEDNLRYSRGLICKKCNYKWFVKRQNTHDPKGSVLVRP